MSPLESAFQPVAELVSASRRCAICQSTDTVVLFRKQGIDYSECRACRFRFSSPDVNLNLANALDDYQAAYLQYLAPEPADTANFDALRAWMEKRCALRNARLLDVGAGSGKLVRHLAACDVDAEGLEPSRALFDHFLSGDTKFTCDLLGNYRRSTTKRFDAITAFDVIEHVADPVEFLEQVAALLNPGGAFFVSTPDVNSIAARAFGRRWHFYYPYHLSYFSPKTLAAAAKRHGLTLIDVTHRGKLRSLGYVARYAAEFIGGRAAPRWASRFDSWYLPINLFDVMYLCFRREHA
jgi:2-polyprenyl-3-methyl-5-hydroxy-6-metoxy-1,4-benzoquinol methylase